MGWEGFGVLVVEGFRSMRVRGLGLKGWLWSFRAQGLRGLAGLSLGVSGSGL